ncbi:hypothetical protein HDU96_005169, partial [Phlyctochytrium bullatum]
ASPSATSAPGETAFGLEPKRGRIGGACLRHEAVIGGGGDVGALRDAHHGVGRDRPDSRRKDSRIRLDLRTTAMTAVANSAETLRAN